MLDTLKRIYAKLNDDTESSLLLGIETQTVRGTIRDKTDYDDAWFLALAQNSRVIFDIGCNSGYTALLAFISDSSKDMLLVDANPTAMAMAVRNLALNKMINNARTFIGFVSDKPDEKVAFFTVGSGAAGSMFRTHAKTAGRANASISVNTTTIDILMKQYNLIPDFVKIDVEGAESFVVNGSIELAFKRKTRFLVEMHSSPEMSMTENAERILRWCKDTGFAAWYMKSREILQTEQQIAHRGKCHLLLQPDDWSYPDFLAQINQGDPLPSEL